MGKTGILRQIFKANLNLAVDGQVIGRRPASIGRDVSKQRVESEPC